MSLTPIKSRLFRLRRPDSKKIKRIEEKLFGELTSAANEVKDIIIGSSAFFFVNFINQITKDYKSQHGDVNFKCMEYSTEEAIFMESMR